MAGRPIIKMDVSTVQSRFFHHFRRGSWMALFFFGSDPTPGEAATTVFCARSWKHGIWIYIYIYDILYIYDIYIYIYDIYIWYHILYMILYMIYIYIWYTGQPLVKSNSQIALCSDYWFVSCLLPVTLFSASPTNIGLLGDILVTPSNLYIYTLRNCTTRLVNGMTVYIYIIYTLNGLLAKYRNSPHMLHK